MSHREDSFNDAELAMLALEIAKDFKELSIKANVDPDDSFVSKFEIEPDIIHPSRSISYSDDHPKPPPLHYPPPIHDELDKLTIVSLSANDPKPPPLHYPPPIHDELDKLTIVSLSANDSLPSIPALPQDTKHLSINIHQ
eukprot:286413_1